MRGPGTGPRRTPNVGSSWAVPEGMGTGCSHAICQARDEWAEARALSGPPSLCVLTQKDVKARPVTRTASQSTTKATEVLDNRQPSGYTVGFKTTSVSPQGGVALSISQVLGNESCRALRLKFPFPSRNMNLDHPIH